MNRALRVVAPAVLVLVAFLAMLAALAFGGGADAPLIADPGAAVRYGLPVAKLIVNLGAAGMIGSLALVCYGLPAGGRNGPDDSGAVLDFAAASAGVMTVASAVTGFLSYLSVTGIRVSGSQQFNDGLSAFVTGISLGQAWLATTLIAAALTVLCFAVRNRTALLVVTALALVSLLPMAQQGHAAGAAGHDDAVTALGLHLVFAAVWVGGLLAVAVVHRMLPGERLAAVIERYSTLAIVCFAVVAASGYASAALRIGTLDRLITPYGVLVLVKAAALVALGVFGVVQRRLLIARLRAGGGRGVFWWFVTAELAFMGVASGVAVALARTATPVSETIAGDLTPAGILTGEPLPPAATVARYLGSWNLDLLWVLGCAFALFFYLAGVWRLRRRGERWPALRTVSWVAGVLLLFYVTNGGVNVYEKYLYSAHAAAQMLLAVLVPLLLVPSAPITLALSAINPRTDASRGPREWVLLASRSRLAGYLSHPIVTAGILAGSLWVFYFTPVFSWSTTNQAGHECATVCLLAAGYLFTQSIVGVDPVPYRASLRMRLVPLAATAAVFAVVGLVIAGSSGLFLADWYGAMGRTWGPSALGDQRIGGLVALGIGEAGAVIIAVALAVRVRLRRPVAAPEAERMPAVE